MSTQNCVYTEGRRPHRNATCSTKADEEIGSALMLHPTFPDGEGKSLFPARRCQFGHCILASVPTGSEKHRMPVLNVTLPRASTSDFLCYPKTAGGGVKGEGCSGRGVCGRSAKKKKVLIMDGGRLHVILHGGDTEGSDLARYRRRCCY